MNTLEEDKLLISWELSIENIRGWESEQEYVRKLCENYPPYSYEEDENNASVNEAGD